MAALADPPELELADVVEVLESEQAALQAAAKGEPVTKSNGQTHYPNRRSYTDEEREKLKLIVAAISSGDEAKIRAAYLVLEPPHPAEELAEMPEPDRTEGAADDGEPITQEQREATGEWDFEGEDPPAAAPIEPGPLDAETAQRLQESSGLAADQAEARGEQATEEPPPGEHFTTSSTEHTTPDEEEQPTNLLGEPEPEEHDLAVWQAIVGGEQPDEHKIKIVASKATITGDPAGGVKKGGVYEIRATVRAQGYKVTDKYKGDGELEVIEERELHVLDATFVDPAEPAPDAVTATREMIETAVKAGVALGKRASGDSIEATVQELVG